jgi:hypothetical protein
VSREEYAQLLNGLLECERAGAMLLAAYCDALPSRSVRRAWLSEIQRAKARNCSVLGRLLLEEGCTPSPAVGELYRLGLQIPGWEQRLAFVTDGQRELAERIAAALPAVAAFPEGRRSLGGMLGIHLENILVCEEMA